MAEIYIWKMKLTRVPNTAQVCRRSQGFKENTTLSGFLGCQSMNGQLSKKL